MATNDGPVLELDIQLAADAPPLPATADFPGWIRAALVGDAAERGLPALDGAVSLRLVGLEEGASLNATWRHKQGATNVLAFPGPSPSGVRPAGMPLEYGDLVICLPVVLREAADQGKAPGSHLAHLVVHGTLHLLGHTHDEKAAAVRMEALETRILAGFGIADPYVMR